MTESTFISCVYAQSKASYSSPILPQPVAILKQVEKSELGFLLHQDSQTRSLIRLRIVGLNREHTLDVVVVS